MIGKLRGFIDSITQDKCIIDVNGVGYVVFLSSKTASALRNNPKDKETSLIIETLVKEDAIELYGFISEIERVWFLELTKVQGVGNKMGQKILSALTIEEIAKALVSNDSKAFSQISGIGPKLASRLTTELKDSPKKLGVDVNFDPEELDNSNIVNDNKLASDAISALENLGYKKHDCLKAINILIKENPNVTLENLITMSLRKLSQNKF